LCPKVEEPKLTPEEAAIALEKAKAKLFASGPTGPYTGDKVDQNAGEPKTTYADED